MTASINKAIKGEQLHHTSLALGKLVNQKAHIDLCAAPWHMRTNGLQAKPPFGPHGLASALPLCFSSQTAIFLALPLFLQNANQGDAKGFCGLK